MRANTPAHTWHVVSNGKRDYGADEEAVVEADAEEDEGKGGRDEGESERWKDAREVGVAATKTLVYYPSCTQ